MIPQLINLQRKIRANLSILYNHNEVNTKKEQKLSEEVKILGNKIIKSRKNNYKKTHKIFSNETLKIIINKKLLNFLQYSFIQKMFFVHNRLFLNTYLREFKKSKDWHFWNKLIKENNVGNPVRYFLDSSTSGNKIFQTYHLKKYQEFSKNKIKNYRFIFEFGGGYGNMATTFLKINPKLKYLIFDTPEINLLQYYYIKKNNIDVGIGYKNKNKKIVLVNSFRDLKKIINENQDLKKLFIANWSLSEAPLKLRKNIDILLNKFDNQLISFQKIFENIDNLKYFKKLNKNNLEKNRISKLIEVPKIKDNYYLFSKQKNKSI